MLCTLVEPSAVSKVAVEPPNGSDCEPVADEKVVDQLVENPFE